ncbi:MAG: fibronectin type III domain-containing protein, partial [Candidatus Dormibacteraeota bacterium]|nr:fibronectin type III domain-containing protein [Candidatus Dormibacteraeota bacterium]
MGQTQNFGSDDRRHVHTKRDRWRTWRTGPAGRVAIVLCALGSVLAASVPAQALASFDSGGGGGVQAKPAAIAPAFPAPMAMPPSASTTLPTSTPAHPSSPSSSSSTSPATAADTWTPFSHAHHNKDGTITTELHVDPIYRKSNGTWTTIDPAVHATGKPAQPLSSESSLWPVRFGAAASDIVELELDKGPLSLTSDALAIGQPDMAPGGVTYRGVATDADLQYSVTSAGVEENVVLKSAVAPTSYTFHLADPHHQLGTVSRASDGGYVFSTLFDGEVQVEIPPAFAYQPSNDARPVIPDPSSAHLTVVPRGDGFDITQSVDGTWLAGKSFPVVLDPTLWFRDAYGLYGLSINVPNGCGGCNTIKTQTTPVGVGSFDYGSSGDYLPMRSHFYWNIAPYIPQYSAVSSASFNGYVTGCFEDQPADFHCNQNTYNEELHQITQSWDASATYDSMNAITNPTAFSTLSQGPFCISYQPGGCGYVPNGCGNCFWQAIDMTAVTQGWVSDPSRNFGVTAMLHEPVPYNIGGPTWDYTQSYPPPTGNHPFLAVTFDPAPSAPGTPSATPGNGQATVSWGASSANGGSSISEYVVQAWSNGQFVSNTSVCGSCATATVTGLTNGTPYYFSVYAVDADGMRSPESPNSNIVTPSAIVLTKSVVQTSPFTAASPQPFFSRGEIVTYQLTVTDPMAVNTTVQALSDQLPPGLAGISGNLLFSGGACPCKLLDNQFTLTAPVALTAGASDVFTYEAVAL